MLSQFPQLLFLSPFAALILRVTVGLFFLYVGYMLWGERKEITRARLPMLGYPREWMIVLSAGLTIVVAIALLAGFKAQLAAMLAALVCLKHLLIPRSSIPVSVNPLSRAALILLLVMCACLVVTGAGPFAFDLPI